jgi:hypothetical protein
MPRHWITRSRPQTSPVAGNSWPRNPEPKCQTPFMTRLVSVRCTRAHRTRRVLYVAGLASILFVAFLLPSLMAPETSEAQSSALARSTPGPRAEVVDGVPLVRTTKAERAQCQRFADHLKRPVPCPDLLPDPIPIPPTSSACFGEVGALGEASCGPAGIQLDGNLFELSQSNFRVPPDYVGVSFEQDNGKMVPDTSISGGPLGHFVFMAGTDLKYVMTNQRGKDVVPIPSYCSPLDAARLIHVHGHVAKLYQCADSPNSRTETQIVLGHTVLVWNDAGVTCEVSFHGHSQVNVDLDVAMANGTVLVPPREP